MQLAAVGNPVLFLPALLNVGANILHCIIQQGSLGREHAVTGMVKQREFVWLPSTCVRRLQHEVCLRLLNREHHVGTMLVERLPDLGCGHARFGSKNDPGLMILRPACSRESKERYGDCR